MNKNKRLCFIENDDFHSKRDMPPSLWRYFRWGIHNAFACLRVLYDFTSRQLFKSVEWVKKKRRLPPVRNDLLLQSATVLAKKIRQRKLTSETLVRACIDRIAEVQPQLNVVIEHRFEAALDEARVADRIMTTLCPEARKQLEQDLPFLGVPFSVSDGLKIKGLIGSYGCASINSTKAEDDSEIVALLRKSGAIPLCVTNASEFGVWYESDNCIHGASKNPFSIYHTPGGPCGGEASLQSAAGIPLSIGCGCVQLPAAFCGLFSHKLSSMTSSSADSETDIGIFCRFVEDLEPMVRLLAGDKINLEDEVPLTKIHFYYIDCEIGHPLFVSSASPEVRQSMMRLVSFLEDNFAIECRPAKLPVLTNAATLFVERARRKNLPVIENLTREWIKWILGRGDHIFPFLLISTVEKCRNVVDRVRLTHRLSTLTESSTTLNVEIFQNELSELLGNDGVLLCPASPTAVPYLFETLSKPFNSLYAEIFNLIGAAVTTVPVGLDREGLPLGVQVVASPNNDRLSLTVAQELERPFGGWNPPFNENPPFY